MASDRIFGLVATVAALAYCAGALRIQTSFLGDPVGPRAFPLLVGAIAVLCGIAIMVRPDDDPDWPPVRTLGALAVTVLVLVAYAYTIRAGGFLVPTAVAAGVLSYQINPRPGAAALAGIGLSVGLFVIFRYVFGLGLFALPRALTG